MGLNTGESFQVGYLWGYFGHRPQARDAATFQTWSRSKWACSE
ncbi:hypothetical protein SBA4_4670019 [Candidatus Sulfopaludibacter sp. SbA4]|nr:hypothetical protein SBA4_4670019 [Candidatus Sulfopaludibacter sp. SbA4]